MNDQISKYSDTEIKIDKVIPSSQIISKDSIMGQIKVMDQSILLAQQRVDSLNQKKLDLEALLQQANDLGVKSSDELAQQTEPPQGQPPQ